MLRDEELLQVMNEAFDRYDEEAVQTLDGRKLAIARAVERAAYERAAAHVRTLKRDQWYLRVAQEIVVEECAVAIEKLMMQEQPR